MGINIVGNVAVDASGRSNARTVVLRSRLDVPRFAVLARSISRAGSLAGIQLASAPDRLLPKRRWTVRNKDAEIARLRKLVLEYTDQELAEHLEAFLLSASLATLAKFDVVQIHAAHGYLLSLLVHPMTNVRRGRFALDNHWFEDFVQNFRELLGDNLSSIRISVIADLMSPEEEIEFSRGLLLRAASNGIDIVDLSAGFYTVDKKLIYPGSELQAPVYATWIDYLARNIDCLITVAGRFTDLRGLAKALPPNILIALGRSLIADPHFAIKSRDGKFDEITKCELRNQCHYFSRGRESLECGVNPKL